MNITEENNNEWQQIADRIGGELGESVVRALKDFYTLYSPGEVEWLAKLYDAKIGGFYYSNNARDLDSLVYKGNVYNLLPDIESTQQALRIISDSGLAGKVGASYAKALPKEMIADIGRYIKGLQHENGFFYNPQWGEEFTDARLSRRARDLMWSCDILSKLGISPTYDTPTGVKGDGLDVDGNPVNAVGASYTAEREEKPKSSVAIPKELENKESFINYLNSLDIKHESYSVGNTLTAITGQIIYRDRELEAAGADYSLRKIIIDWLNENQNPENGLWHEKADYYGVNGLMKTSGVYGKIGVLMPHADKAVRSAIDAISTDETPSAVTCIYNTWYAVTRIKRHLRTYGGDEGQRMADKIVADLRETAPEAIRITKEKLSVFKKPDGSFSYSPLYSSARSQGCPVTAEKSVEGDVNATCICSSDIVYYICSALGIEDIIPPIFGDAERAKMLEIFENSLKSK